MTVCHEKIVAQSDKAQKRFAHTNQLYDIFFFIVKKEHRKKHERQEQVTSMHNNFIRHISIIWILLSYCRINSLLQFPKRPKNPLMLLGLVLHPTHYTHQVNCCYLGAWWKISHMGRNHKQSDDKTND